MPDIKLTKNEFRDQQHKLAQLQRYLPTLQLKKAMLQAEVQEAREEIEKLNEEFVSLRQRAEEWLPLLVEKVVMDPCDVAKVVSVEKHYENIAGVEVPYFEGVTFEEVVYSLFETPPWFDGVVAGLRAIAQKHAEIVVSEEKKMALERELREVSIRVNLFEKVLIPRALANIKTIKVFLGDQELAAVSQAKVAKNKIEFRKKEKQVVEV